VAYFDCCLGDVGALLDSGHMAFFSSFRISACLGDVSYFISCRTFSNFGDIKIQNHCKTPTCSGDVSCFVVCLPVQVTLAASVHSGRLPACLLLAALMTAGIQHICM
jgi:hypothetical protein